MKEVKLLLGDNLITLKTLADNSVDSVVTDPPYALTSIKKRFGKEGSAPAQFGNDGAFKRLSGGFMGKLWDSDVPSVELWQEVYRVLKPGGHVLSFGGTRTYHRMVVNLEDAGFEIRDTISWIYGSGFPKSLNISKAIDKRYGRLGVDLTDIKNELRDLYKKSGKTMKKIDDECGFKASGYLRIEHRDDDGWGEALPSVENWNIIKNVINYIDIDIDNRIELLFSEAEREITGKGSAGFLESNEVFGIDNKGYGEFNLTKSKTIEGIKYEGWGTSLKPAQELICLARKPISEKTIVNNVMKWGTGGINIDGSRISGVVKDRIGGIMKSETIGQINNKERNCEHNEQGRFPANIIFDTEAAKVLDEQSGFSKTNIKGNSTDKSIISGNIGFSRGINYKREDQGGASRYFKNIEVEDYDSFFYCAKVSTKEKNDGLEDLKSTHPTIKPIKLMSYLCKLITPEDGVILDPYMGSGSTGVAALQNNFNFIGCEMDEEYMKIAEARINHSKNK